jgi:hypothetical protein
MRDSRSGEWRRTSSPQPLNEFGLGRGTPMTRIAVFDTSDQGYNSSMVRLRDSRWLEIVIATTWIGVVAILWPHIKPSPQFERIVAWGIGFAWPYSIAYVLLVYLILFAVIVWAGVAVYLAVLARLEPQYFVRALWMSLLTVGIVQAGGLMWFAGRDLSPITRWLLWLPYAAALVLCMEIARRSAYNTTGQPDSR